MPATPETLKEDVVTERPRTPAPGGRLRIALGEYDTGWENPAVSLDRAAVLVERAADGGAELVVLPEMCASGFSMAVDRVAEPVPGPSSDRLAELARRFDVCLLAGLAVREAGVAVNAALLFGPDGQLRARYRKQRLFPLGGEDRAYVPGRDGVVAEVGPVRLSPFICYDLRFPELFRAVGPAVDLLVVMANWPTARQAHWEAMLPARAIENQCYLVAVNRVGDGGGFSYQGGSAAFHPWGEPLLAAPTGPAGPLVVEVDPAEVTRIRSSYPFVEDRRHLPWT